jgi:type I restriction enzyme M protein
VETKRKLLDECDLWCILSLPGGVFSAAGAGVKTNLVFLTKGRKTERIWYYDLSQVKVGKKTPLTLAHFGFGPAGETLDDSELPSSLTGDWSEQEGNEGKPFPAFARMLTARGSAAAETDFSWTVDFSARRSKAREDMAPHLAMVEEQKAAAVAAKDRLVALRKRNADALELDMCRAEIATAEKAARDAQARADAIDAAVYDLKAVNPRAVLDTDNRTPVQIIESIEAHGQTITNALSRLKETMSVNV